MIIDRSDAPAVKPIPRYPEYQRNGGGQMPGEGINQVQIPAANRIAPPQITPVVTPNGGAPPTPGAGLPTWAKIGIAAVGVLFLMGGLSR